MQFHQLKRIHPNTKRMIVARGGRRGKTSGRGGKGQTARAGNKRRPEWRDIIKKIPKLRGRGISQNKSIQEKPIAVNVGVIEEIFSAGDQITPTILVQRGVLETRSGRIPAVKILGDGEITKAVKFSGIATSESARLKIEKAGGSVEMIVPKLIANQKRASVYAPKVFEHIQEEGNSLADKSESKGKSSEKKAKAAEHAKPPKPASAKIKPSSKTSKTSSKAKGAKK